VVGSWIGFAIKAKAHHTTAPTLRRLSDDSLALTACSGFVAFGVVLDEFEDEAGHVDAGGLLNAANAG